MKIIALLSQKGGSGKTTISLNFAIAATLQGHSAVIINLDPQQSAARWARLRSSDTGERNVRPLVERSGRRYPRAGLVWRLRARKDTYRRATARP
ncbi:MAG: ParA family protein [Hyphomicrobium sp.]